MTGEGGLLVCPSCGTRPNVVDERFCDSCGMPLVHEDGSSLPAVDDRRERLRKIKPHYTEGELVRVAGGRNQAEAELIQGMLLEQGVPSLLRRSRGFDVPDMLAAGPRDVMVPASGAAVARETLLEAELIGSGDAASDPQLRVLFRLMIAAALVAIVAWIGVELFA